MTPKEERPRGLGRGLSALIGDEAVPTRGEMPKATRTLPVAFLRPGKFQPRKNFADDALNDLAASVKEKGVLMALRREPAPVGEMAKKAFYEVMNPKAVPAGDLKGPDAPKGDKVNLMPNRQ